MTRKRPSNRRIAVHFAPILAAATAAAVLVACGPDPAQVDRSPTAGMTAADPTPGTFSGEDIVAAPANQAHLDLTGDFEAAGPASVDCAVLPEADAGEGHGLPPSRVRLTLGPKAGSSPQLVVTVDGYHGEGDYQAVFRLQSQAEDGSFQESRGSGSVSLYQGTMLSNEPATHWLSGSFRGGFQGAAGRGEAAGRVERCYYFE